MSLWQRLSTLAKAESHGVMETLEDDRLLLRQHLRDAETAVAAKKAKLESMAGEIRNLEQIQNRWITRHGPEDGAQPSSGVQGPRKSLHGRAGPN